MAMSSQATAAPPGMAWIKNYSLPGFVYSYSMDATGDGYVIVGTGLIGNQSGPALVKTDLYGNLLWNKTYIISGRDMGNQVIKVNDGLIVAGGRGYTGDTYNILKTDFNGNLLWNKSYKKMEHNEVKALAALSDGYIVAGEILLPDRSSAGLSLFKTDLNGNLLWNKVFENLNQTYVFSITSDKDSVVIMGMTSAYKKDGKIEPHFFYTGIDFDGNLKWNTSYVNSNIRELWGIVAVKNGYVICGSTGHLGESGDIALRKIDRKGNLIWDKTYGGSKTDIGYDMIADDDGVVVVGISNSFVDGGDVNASQVYLFKASLDGKLIWNATYGATGFNGNMGFALTATNDSYVIAGLASPDGYNMEYILIETAGRGEAAPTPAPDAILSAIAIVATAAGLILYRKRG